MVDQALLKTESALHAAAQLKQLKVMNLKQNVLSKTLTKEEMEDCETLSDLIDLFDERMSNCNSTISQLKSDLENTKRQKNEAELNASKATRVTDETLKLRHDLELANAQVRHLQKENAELKASSVSGKTKGETTYQAIIDLLQNVNETSEVANKLRADHSVKAIQVDIRTQTGYHAGCSFLRKNSEQSKLYQVFLN